MSNRPYFKITHKDPARIDALRTRINKLVLEAKLAGDAKCTQIDIVEAAIELREWCAKNNASPDDVIKVYEQYLAEKEGGR